MKWVSVVYSSFVVAVLFILLASSGLGQVAPTSSVPETIENEVKYIEMRIEMLREVRDRFSYDSPQFVDLDKNIGDLYKEVDIVRERITQVRSENAKPERKKQAKQEMRVSLDKIHSLLDSLQAE